MKTNIRQAGAKTKRPAQSKQAKAKAAAPVATELPTRAFPDSDTVSAEYERLYAQRNALQSDEERQRAALDFAGHGERAERFINNPLPGMFHYRDMEPRAILAALVRPFGEHRVAITTAVRAHVSPAEFVHFTEAFSVTEFLWKLDATGLSFPDTFKLGFLDGVSSQWTFDLDDALFHVAELWMTHREIIIESVWRPLASVAPRLAMPVAQAIALAEAWDHERGGGVCERLVADLRGDANDTTAMFYARWTAEELARQASTIGGLQ